MLGAAAQQRGCCVLEDGSCELTLYTSCCDADTGVYYYTTYDSGHVSAVDMHREELDGSRLVSYPLREKTEIFRQNG